MENSIKKSHTTIGLGTNDVHHVMFCSTFLIFCLSPGLSKRFRVAGDAKKVGGQAPQNTKHILPRSLPSDNSYILLFNHAN